MQRRIFLTEKQIKCLNEDFKLDTYGKNSGVSGNDDIHAHFDTKLTKMQGSGDRNDSNFKDKFNSKFYSSTDANSIARYIPSDNDFIINPITKSLLLGDGTNIRCWALGPLTNADYNHAFKEDIVNSTGNPIVWEEGLKDKLFSYCADYFSKLIPLASQQEGIKTEDIKYIAWPESSKDFNNVFCRTYLVPSLKNVGIEISNIIPNIVSKSNSLIKINYELAQKLGCDDVDIKTLQMFITQQEKIQSTIVIRTQIEKLLNEIKNVLDRNNAKEFYQYTSGNNSKEKEINKTNSKYSHTVGKEGENTGLYLDTDKKWDSNTTSQQDVNVTKGESKKPKYNTYSIDSKTLEVIQKLVEKKDEIIKIYEESQKELDQIRQSDTQSIETDKGTFNFGHFNPRSEGKNNINQNGGQVTSKFLDKMVGDDGTLRNSKWQIKGLPDVYRSVLTGIFQVKDQADEIWQNIDRTKTLLLFDDNVAGGNTMAKVCDALLNAPEDIRWKKILPITISLMRTSQGMNEFQISKQKDYRDKNTTDGIKSLSQQEKDSVHFWSGDKNGLYDVTEDPSKRRDIADIYLTQHEGEDGLNYSEFRKLNKGYGRVKVFSLSNFKEFCQKEGINDSNVETEHPNWIFIEIGSTKDRVKLDVGRSIKYDSRIFKNRESAAEDYYNNKRFYFKNDHKNVLRVTFDDNMNIGNNPDGSTSVVYSGREIVTDKDGRNRLFNNKKPINKNGKYNEKYFNGVGFSRVEEQVFDFIEEKINEFGDDIMFFIHCEQGASRSAALGYYISKRINDDINHYLISHSTFNDSGNFVKSQFRIGKDDKNGYRTMHNTIFKNLGKRFAEKYGPQKIGFGDKSIKDFIDNYMYGKSNLNGTNYTPQSIQKTRGPKTKQQDSDRKRINESQLMDIIKETILEYLRK
jgi:hypothetical protein